MGTLEAGKDKTEQEHSPTDTQSQPSGTHFTQNCSHIFILCMNYHNLIFPTLSSASLTHFCLRGLLISNRNLLRGQTKFFTIHKLKKKKSTGKKFLSKGDSGYQFLKSFFLKKIIFLNDYHVKLVSFWFLKSFFSALLNYDLESNASLVNMRNTFLLSVQF